MFTVMMYLFGLFCGVGIGICAIMFFLLTDELEELCKQIASGRIFKIKFNLRHYNYDIESGKSIRGKIVYGGWYEP